MNKTVSFRFWLLAALLLTILSGCSSNLEKQPSDPTQISDSSTQQVDTPIPTSTFQSQPTNTQELTAIPTAEATPTIVVYPENGWKGWQKYTNTTYGFSFQYPPGWKLEEPTSPKGESTLKGHAVWLIPNTTGQARMQIAFKHTSED